MKRFLAIAAALAAADAHAAPLDDAINCANYATIDAACREQKDPSAPLLGKLKTAAGVLHGRSIRIGGAGWDFQRSGWSLGYYRQRQDDKRDVAQVRQHQSVA
ncbi:hypothetical protein ACVW0J_005054 [Bradyrhizobium sp. i1.7.7]